MGRSKDNGKLLAIVRGKDSGNFLDPVWEKCAKNGLVGRCWGTNGSTILLGENDEIIVLSENREGNKIEIWRYSLDKGDRSSELKEKIKKQIKSAGIDFEEKKDEMK